MKVGDLVQLSSYGVNREYNAHMTRVDPKQIGIIIEIQKRYIAYPYRVYWITDPRPNSHSRRELKRASR